MIVQDYINLITSEYANQPNFVAMVSVDVDPLVQVQALNTAMLALFDLSTPPLGDQLDIIGQWVGVSRDISPISGVGIWFSWDDHTHNDGWDSGSWQPPDSPTEVTILPDDAYLTLIKAKIAANQWDGTTEGAYAIWAILFPDLTILIQDDQDMSYKMVILGEVSALDLALLAGGYIQLKPEAVDISGYYTGLIPIFAFDVSSPLLQGWDIGNWATIILP